MIIPNINSYAGIFNLLKESTFLNNKALLINYPNGTTSTEILFEGSKTLPRKSKKKLRNLIKRL
jgi:hypothetical protein